MYKEEELTKKIISAAIQVHRTLGPGLLESAYQKCLEYELMQNGLTCRSEFEVPVVYKGISLSCGYRIDLLVEDKVIVELKAVDSLNSVHEAQLLTYMRLAKKEVGLLINFNCKMLKQGIKRFVL